MSTPTPKRGRSLPRFADLLALLMWGPRTVPELGRLTGMYREHLRRWLAALHDAGVVRIAGKRKAEGAKGQAARLYEMQPTPFALEDTPDVVVKHTPRSRR